MKIKEQSLYLKLNKYISLGAILYAISVFGQEYGHLSVSVDPHMEIYLDSALVANQSFSQLALNTGTYELLVLDNHDFSWNKRALREFVQVLPGQEITKDFQSKNFIKILSRPVGSDVYLGSILLGKTPLILKEDILSGQPVILRKRGYKEKTFAFQDLTDKEYLTLPKADPGNDEAVFEASLGATQVNWFRESLILASFASSWGAFMFKRKADQYYSDYLSSSVPVMMDRYYNESQKYDRYSEIAIGISITTLSVYMLLLILE